MALKKTDLARLAGLRVENAMRHAGTPDRFAQGATAAATSRREQRRLEQAQGLVPFAVKIDGEVVARVRALAAERGVAVDALVTELLRKGLEA